MIKNKHHTIMIKNLELLLNGDTLRYQGRDYKMSDDFTILEGIPAIPGRSAVPYYHIDKIDNKLLYVLLFSNKGKKHESL